MHARHLRRFLASFLLLAVLVLPACGATSGGPIKIYVSLPLQNPQGESVRKGIALALNQAGERAGEFPIVAVYRDNGNSSGQWDPAREEANAREARDDPDVMVYLGPLDSGAAAISIPITNRGGLAQISPGNTAPGLTKVGFQAGWPGEFYPTGRRNYFRVCPTDDVQGPAAALWAGRLGYRSVYILDDGELYGKGVADLFEEKAYDLGIEVKGRDRIDRTLSDFSALAEKVEQVRPDLVFLGGYTENGVPSVVKIIRETGMSVGIMVPDGAADSPFIEKAGQAAEGVLGTLVGAPPDKLTGDVGANFYESYKKVYGQEPESLAQFGYDAARVALDAIRRAGAKNRSTILDAIAATRDFAGTGGKFSFDRNGDTTLVAISGNRVTNHRFEFVSMLPPR